MARPRINIDMEQLEKLCILQCSLKMIAYFFSCSEDTIERVVKREHKARFADYAAQKREVGRQMLRQKQFQVALDGNVAMLIFLGKNWLSQSDTPNMDGGEAQALPLDDGDR